jgi:D-alanine-D-alanine ligase
MGSKICVGVLFGGQSAEHEVSLLSAKNVIEAIDRNKYDVVLVGIDKQGEWHLRDAATFLLHAHDPARIQLHGAIESVALVPRKEGKQLVGFAGSLMEKSVDVIFPVLHGTYGEDGTVQGLLKLAHLPFVGAGVLGSAVGMDKDVMKRLLRDAGLPIARFLVVPRFQLTHTTFDAVVGEVGLPFFVKPANLGSSVGISKVRRQEEFLPAVEEAFRYDHKILIEEYVKGREIECAVLGNECPVASLPGELIPQHEFYSYEAKYLDEDGALFRLPADLPPQQTGEIQRLAVEAFRVLCCEGMARVDFFLSEEGRPYVNEINTIPGFTNISMYPKLWEVSGLSYTQLIDRLIQLALERFERDRRLSTRPLLSSRHNPHEKKGDLG